MKTVYFISILLLLLSQNTIAKAQWSTNATIDDTLNATVYDPLTFCSDGHGGAFFTWTQTFTGVRHDIIVNRIDSLGYLQFGDSGMIIRSDSVSLIASGAPNICEDGHGGCYIVYNDNKTGVHGLIAHHIDSAGNRLWGAAGIQVTEKLKSQYYQAGQVLINDHGNGVMLAFITNITGSDTSTGLNTGPSGIYGQRLDFNGNRQWGVNGKVIQEGSDERQPTIIDDGQNGMAVLWPNYSYEGQGFNYTLRMNRLNHNGQLRFTMGSRKINTDHTIGFGPAFRFVLTKNKNYIAVWNSDGNYPILYTQKIDSLGNWLWADSAIRIRDTVGEARYPNLVSDGNEGAYVSWLDGRKINVSYGLYAQHLTNNGTRQWTDQGIPIDTAASGNFPQILADTGNTFKLFWIPSSDNRMHLQRVNSNGTLLMSGNGTALSTPGHVPFYYKSVQPASNNHDILFLKVAGNGKCFAKYVPFDNILPLTFIRFSAVKSGNKNVLTWNTADENKTAHFSIERSEDGNRFYEIGTLKSSNTTGTHDYTYEDFTSSNPAVYYRIKETDADGKFSYSTILRLNLVIRPVTIVPNPAVSETTVYFNNITSEKTPVTITDINGKQQQVIMIPKGQSFVTINVSQLPSGIYIISSMLKDSMWVQKLVVSR